MPRVPQGKKAKLYHFATVAVAFGFETSASYSLVTGPGELTELAVGRALPGGLRGRYLVHDAAGECIGKVEQTAFASKTIKADLAAGVDQWAVVVIALALYGHGGSPAGGLAGAGAA